jgi:hypothetical protein
LNISGGKVNLNSITENEEKGIEDSTWNVLDSLAERDIIQLIQELITRIQNRI